MEGSQGPDAFPGPAATHTGQSLKILLAIAPQTLGEVLPWQLRSCLDRRLRQLARGPARDSADICVPRAGQQTPECIVDRLSGPSAIIHEAVDHGLVHLGRRDAAPRTEVHERRKLRPGNAIIELGPQLLPCGRQGRAVPGNAFFSRQPKQRALRVALVVLQRLGGEPGRRLVELGKIGANCGVAGRDHLERLVQCLGHLPQGRRPVSSGLLRELGRRGDDRDGLGEGRLDQGGGLGHWDRHHGDCDGWGLTQVYLGSFWENVKAKFR